MLYISGESMHMSFHRLY